MPATPYSAPEKKRCDRMMDIVGAGATMARVEDDMAWVKVVVVGVKTALRGPRSRLA